MALYQYGINLMVLLKLGERYGERTAIVDDDGSISYKQLSVESERLASILSIQYQLSSGQKVGILCHNHSTMIKTIFACSLLGSDIYLLHTAASKSQLQTMLKENRFDLLVCDGEWYEFLESSNSPVKKILNYHEHLPSIQRLLLDSSFKQTKLPKTSNSKLVLLTGGTTGAPKEAIHKPSMVQYINPFLGMLNKLKLLNYQTAYIATPIYHGYGIAVLLLFLALGKKVVISKRFQAEKACALICQHRVEVITVVPLMLQKMLGHDVKALNSLRCIASGSAPLQPKLVKEVSQRLGKVLYNLYGTSETGLNIIATPDDLLYSPKTIGKKISGVQLFILNQDADPVGVGEIGELYLKNRWTRGNRTSWIATGDLAYQDHNGYYFLCGRTDDMIVSAGINVYPIELEQVLITHPFIKDVAVVGISDEFFGGRLKAFVQIDQDSDLTKDELSDWIKSRVGKQQVPKEIVFIDKMPYTSLGKLDKKQLR
jgi:fatty-acyl-CoA synthase